MAVTKKIEEIYKKVSQEDHVLLRPDTYVGSTLVQEKSVWAVKNTEDLAKIEITKQSLKYIPAFLKLFDEILTNASDHVQRNSGVKTIKVTVTPDFKISVWNDGAGIPIQMHKEHNVYVPELIFGHLLTGSNYDDTEERFGAGRNGLGSKLVSIFSKKFVIDCADGKKSYYQELNNNLKIKTTPSIKPSTKSYTCITYTTDFERLPIKGLEKDTMKLFVKRVIDIAAYNPKVKVYFNETLININSMTDWCKLHLHESDELFIEQLSDKWAIGLSQSRNDNFEQCSIVNGNTTWQGGTHVDFIMNQIIKRLIEDLTKGNKGIKIKPSDIKSKFHLFLISKIANPTFDTQTKETLTIKIEDRVDLSDKLYKQLLKSEIIQSILEWVQMKEQMELNKMNKKSGGKTVRVEKLVDAHKAGTGEGYKCNLLLCEGDSAVQTALAGLAAVGREYYGAFPLKGKVLNVRDVKVSKITENDEIQKILQIVGLVPGKKYSSVAELRYGKVIFMTDADVDGTSIKGLLINFIHKFWPELLELGFCFEFITPIVIAKKSKDVKEYYNLSNYLQEKEKGKLEGYTIKYYKGLGTIKSEEIKEMFKNLPKHLIKFNYIEDRDSDKIDMLFKKERVTDRREWLLSYKGEIVPDKFGKPNDINDFIDNEFIQFSNADNIRSIPNMIDGLKPSQRKIMFAGFKKLGTTEKDETKVAQFGAYTAEVSAYHHGEVSLMKAIVGMAQNFVGSNNIPLLYPSGQFGTRRNPDASASPRYIFTYLNPLTKLIFRKEDEQILNYLNEDGQIIEPDFYLPIIPTLLVNGSDGIGTGWSTNIPKFNPLSLIKVIKKKLEKPTIKYNINPDFQNWTGELDWNDDKNCYVSKGVWQKGKKGILITELPIDVWTEAYIAFLDKLCDEKKIRNYIDNSTDNSIHIEVILTDDTKSTEIESLLKLTNNISLNNMHTFLDNKIIKWSTTEDMLNKWFDIRLEYYSARKKSWISVLEKQYERYYNILCFLKAVIDGDVVINNRKKDQIIKDMTEMEFLEINGNFDYLLNIPIYHFTKEKFDEYKALAKDMKQELAEYKAMKPGDIWLKDLEELEAALKKAGY
jgi:DNA topoisomerase II